MKKFIFTIAFFMAAVANSSATETADTIRTYSIDGVRIKDFTGKELAGKTVKSYEILYATVADGKTIVETHLIETTTPPAKKPLEPHYILDGKEIYKKDLNSVSPTSIESIEVFKAGSKAALQYGKDGDNRGYVIIKTKK